MPQDKRRSISYRSFVTCDDPKGVECGVIRKSKINSQKKVQDSSNKVEADIKQKNHQKSSSVEVTVIKEERGKKEMGIRGITRARLEAPVSYQLHEVSKEAEKLNHVINSWSYDKLLKESQDYIAKDLLRGALGLQESLVMLGRLQEASSYMLGLSRKQKQKVEEGTFDGMVSGVRGVHRSPVLGVDEWECPRKSCDEMRNAVRDSLLRQSMISNPVFEEHYDHRKMASPDMMPSTSSSQSSMMYSSNFVPSDSSVSSLASQRKEGKKSNVIVKLMGLESFPSSPRKHMEKEKILNLVKPTYDIDSPKAKRPQFGGQEEGMKQKSVEEILESLKFKGLLRYPSVNDQTISSPESEVFSSKDCWVDETHERPPIVLMKPFRYPCIDLDGPFILNPREGSAMKPRYSRLDSAQDIVRNGVKFSEKYGTAGMEFEEKTKPVRKVASPKSQRKQAEVKKASEVEKVTPIRRKGDEKKGAKSSEQLSSRDQEKVTTTKIKRHTDGKSVSKNQTSSQQKIASTPMLDHRKRGTSERKKNRQPALVVLEEKDFCKDENKAVCKVDIDSTIDNAFVYPTIDNVIDDKEDNEMCQIQIRDYDIDCQTEVLKVSEGIPNDKMISHYNDTQSSHSEITSVSTSDYCHVDQHDEVQSCIPEVTLITTHENGVEVRHDTNQEGHTSVENGTGLSERTDNETLSLCLTPRTKLKALLLSNSSFVSHVEELFNIQVSTDLVPSVVDDNDQDIECAELLIDCAIEVLELERSQYPQARLPLALVYTPKSQTSVSLDRLLEEVCNGIEVLRCYLRPAIDDELQADYPYVLLKQDLSVKSGTWGVGWRHTFTQDEVEQVIGEIDKFVLGKLIDEVVSDFVQ